MTSGLFVDQGLVPAEEPSAPGLDSFTGDNDVQAVIARALGAATA